MILDPLEKSDLPPLLDPGQLLETDERLARALGPDGRCGVAVASLFDAPTTDAQSISELLYGEPIQIIERQDRYVKLVSAIDGYQGWTEMVFLSPHGPPATHRVAASMAHLYREPHIKATPIGHLPMGAFVSLTTDKPQDRFVKTTDGYWMFAGHLLKLGETRSDPVDSALKFRDTPYRWGGRSKLGIDCSGLVQVSLSIAGYRVHRDSDLQWQSIGHPLPNGSSPRRGDLAFFPGHVGFMFDDTRLLHANAKHMAVTIDPLEEVIEWVRAEGQQEPFLGFRRIDGISK